MEELTFQLQEKDLTIENLQSQVNKLHTNDFQNEIRTLKNTLKEKENTLSDLESQVTQLQSELSRATRMVEELQDAASRGRMYETEVTQLREELELVTNQMRHADQTEQEVVRQHQTIRVNCVFYFIIYCEKLFFVVIFNKIVCNFLRRRIRQSICSNKSARNSRVT